MGKIHKRYYHLLKSDTPSNKLRAEPVTYDSVAKWPTFFQSRNSVQHSPKKYCDVASVCKVALIMKWSSLEGFSSTNAHAESPKETAAVLLDKLLLKYGIQELPYHTSRIIQQPAIAAML